MTKEKLIEKYNKTFPHKIKQELSNGTMIQGSFNIPIISFLLESINEILDEVEPKEFGDSLLANDRYEGYNKAIADLKDNRKKMGYER